MSNHNFKKSTELQRNQDDILLLLKSFHNLCVKNNINYIICGGTLLGAIRHQDFIPWDDDADVDISIDDRDKLLSSIVEIQDKYTLRKVDFGFKFVKKGTSYPFIDVFLTIKENNINSYIHKFTYNLYPNYRNTDDELYPRKLYKFNDTYLYGPNQGLRLCKKLYGEDCMTIYVIQKNKHFFEKIFNMIFKKKK